MSGLTATLTGVLVILGIALLVRLVVSTHDRIAYASVLVVVGLGAAVVGPDLGVELTSDVIFFLLLATIIFQGTHCSIERDHRLEQLNATIDSNNRTRP